MPSSSGTSKAPLPFLLLPLVSFLFTLITTPCSHAQTVSEGWNDDYRMDYSYDRLSDNGPDDWNTAVQPNNGNGFGEWEAVADTSYIGDRYGDDEDRVDLLKFRDNECGAEFRPSPIELLPSDVCRETSELKTRQFDPQLDCRHPLDMDTRQEDATAPWEITPYSLRYYYPREDLQCLRPTVRMGDFLTDWQDRRNDEEEHFALLWLELHARSEHMLNGKRYDAELQMVHRGTTRYNELVVVSVLIEADALEDHAEFQSYLLDGWQRKALQEEERCNKKRHLTRTRNHLRGDLRQQGGLAAALSEEFGVKKNITDTLQKLEAYNQRERQHKERQLQRNLQGGGGNRNKNCETDKYGHGCEEFGLAPRPLRFPYTLWPSMWYYTYDGSLTSPPCAGQVYWRIMDTPLRISRRQYKQLTYLLTQSRDDRCRMDSATNKQGENFRPLQTPQFDRQRRLQQKQKQKRQQLDQTQNENRELQKENRNDGDNERIAYGEGPQVVAHCTSDNFFVEVFDEDGQ